MTTSDMLLVAGIFVMVVLTQVGRREFTRRKVILPLAVVGGVGAGYLRKLPSGTNNLEMAIALAALGVVFGLLCLVFVRCERDASGKVYTRAGAAYLAVWIVAMGGRLVFGYGAQHWYSASLGRFMMTHQLSPNVWAAGFALMAMTMVGVRTLGVALRVSRLPGRLPRDQGLWPEPPVDAVPMGRLRRRPALGGRMAGRLPRR